MNTNQKLRVDIVKKVWSIVPHGYYGVPIIINNIKTGDKNPTICNNVYYSPYNINAYDSDKASTSKVNRTILSQNPSMPEKITVDDLKLIQYTGEDSHISEKNRNYITNKLYNVYADYVRKSGTCIEHHVAEDTLICRYCNYNDCNCMCKERLGLLSLSDFKRIFTDDFSKIPTDLAKQVFDITALNSKSLQDFEVAIELFEAHKIHANRIFGPKGSRIKKSPELIMRMFKNDMFTYGTGNNLQGYSTLEMNIITLLMNNLQYINTDVIHAIIELNGTGGVDITGFEIFNKFLEKHGSIKLYNILKDDSPLEVLFLGNAKKSTIKKVLEENDQNKQDKKHESI